MSGLWSTTHCHPIAKISKVKDLALILLISVFSLSSYQVFHLLSKIAQAIVLLHFFYSLATVLSTLMRCSSSEVNPVTVAALLRTSFLVFTSLLTKNV